MLFFQPVSWIFLELDLAADTQVSRFSSAVQRDQFFSEGLKYV